MNRFILNNSIRLILSLNRDKYIRCACIESKKLFYCAAILVLLLGFSARAGEAQSFSENAEIYVYEAPHAYDIVLNEYSCLGNSNSKSGCYYVVLQHPEGLQVNYSEETQRRIPESQQERYKIQEGEDGITAILIPGFGGGIQFIHSGTNNVMANHRFSSRGTENVIFYDILTREKGTPLYRDGNVKPEGDITWITDFEEGRQETLQDPETAATPVRNEELGSLLVESDADASAVINGNTYRVNQGISLSAGVYDVTIIHVLGSKTERVEIIENQQAEIVHYFKPLKADAIASGLLIPGTGHITTNRNRGWAYLLGTLGGVALTFERNIKYKDVGDNLESALERYNRAGSIEAAEFARNDVQLLVDEQKDINAQRNIYLVGSILIYTVSVIDLITTKPRYGYRSSEILGEERFSLRPASGFDEFGAHASLKFSITW